MPEHFKNNGYLVLGQGKLYHPNLPPPVVCVCVCVCVCVWCMCVGGGGGDMCVVQTKVTPVPNGAPRTFHPTEHEATFCLCAWCAGCTEYVERRERFIRSDRKECLFVRGVRDVQALRHATELERRER